LGLPVIAHRPALPRGVGHGVDQPAGRTLSAYGLVDEQVLQIAAMVAPDAGMEQIVRDPDQLVIEASAQPMDFPILQQTVPGAIVVAVRQLGLVEVVVATRQLLPGRALGALERTDDNHDVSFSGRITGKARSRLAAKSMKASIFGARWMRSLVINWTRSGGDSWRRNNLTRLPDAKSSAT